MSTIGIGAINPNAAASAAGGAKSKAAQEDAQAVTNFMDYMKETPAQRFEDQWLAAHGLTEKDLEKMSPDKRAAITKQMADDMKKQMQDAVKKASGKTGVASLFG